MELNNSEIISASNLELFLRLNAKRKEKIRRIINSTTWALAQDELSKQESIKDNVVSIMDASTYGRK